MFWDKEFSEVKVFLDFSFGVLEFIGAIGVSDHAPFLSLFFPEASCHTDASGAIRPAIKLTPVLLIKSLWGSYRIDLFQYQCCVHDLSVTILEHTTAWHKVKLVPQSILGSSPHSELANFWSTQFPGFTLFFSVLMCSSYVKVQSNLIPKMHWMFIMLKNWNHPIIIQLVGWAE